MDGGQIGLYPAESQLGMKTVSMKSLLNLTENQSRIKAVLEFFELCGLWKLNQSKLQSNAARKPK